jgi:hypothetical protein
VREYSEVTAGNVRFGVPGMRTSFVGFCNAYDIECESQWAAKEPIAAMFDLLRRVAIDERLSIGETCDYARFTAKQIPIPPLHGSAVVPAKEGERWMEAIRKLTRQTSLHINTTHSDGSLMHLQLSRISPVTIVIWASSESVLLFHNATNKTLSLDAHTLSLCRSCTDCNVATDPIYLYGAIHNTAEQQCIFFHKIKSTNYPIFKNCTWVC